MSNEIVDAQIEIMSAAYDKSIAYGNVIIIAGYASFFAMWSFTKEYLSARQVLWSAILMSISVLCFVLFEIWKMFVSGKLLLQYQRAVAELTQSNDPNQFIQTMRDHGKKEQKMTIAFGKIWYFNLMICIPTGLIAFGILFYAFIAGLVRTY